MHIYIYIYILHYISTFLSYPFMYPIWFSLVGEIQDQSAVERSVHRLALLQDRFSFCNLCGKGYPNLTYTATNWSFSTNWRFSRFLFFWGYQERVVECFGSRNSSNAKEKSRVWPQRMGDWITLKIAADNEVFTLEDHESWGSLGIPD